MTRENLSVPYIMDVTMIFFDDIFEIRTTATSTVNWQ